VSVVTTVKQRNGAEDDSMLDKVMSVARPVPFNLTGPRRGRPGAHPAAASSLGFPNSVDHTSANPVDHTGALSVVDQPDDAHALTVVGQVVEDVGEQGGHTACPVMTSI
jgi:hypothetical protein